ncbi:hypothetical protein MmiEs2_05210 [Methanimicrococcus stummii]|uniref:Uncharacterized protein n=1 Tax=Methanimicrococcus stummii TaxID=3028294 RepID=A0AA96VHJ5_9EURY|nr:DUF6293 family protein [Methanimicrococcus sp. Es2]WNY28336.1 hypothetical protein MmiEs2_05210 [Methanimicrococcus sp. Es2]
MQKIENILRVHIAVVGFEVDRISQAAIDQKADVVYLISKKIDEKGSKYVAENKKKLKKYKIATPEIKIDEVHNVLDVLKAMKKIIQKEKNNLIYINVSSGSTPAAIAGTIVATMFEKECQVRLYYVKPKEYLTYSEYTDDLQPQTEGVEEIQAINIFPALLPDERLIKVLIELHNNDQKNIQLTKQDLIEFSAKELDYKTETNKDNKNKGKYGPREYAWLNKNILEKLNKWEFISTQKKGKNTIILLTDKGKTMVEYLL